EGAIVKRGNPIAAEDVPKVFSDDVIQDLANIGKLGSSADLRRFALGVHAAARTYAKEIRTPDANDWFREVKLLESAARRRDFDRVRKLLDGMSSKCRVEMTHRGTLPGFRNMNGGAPVTLPSAAVMSDPAQRDEACRLVELMCVRGGSV